MMHAGYLGEDGGASGVCRLLQTLCIGGASLSSFFAARARRTQVGGWTMDERLAPPAASKVSWSCLPTILPHTLVPRTAWADM